MTVRPAAAAEAEETLATKPVPCLVDGSAFFRARLAGAIDAELDWRGAAVECTSERRPDGKGLRIKLSLRAQAEPQLVVVFGIASVEEAKAGRALPVNVTVIREGKDPEFFGTQGDDKCTIDELRQQLLTAAARLVRSYRITARGFCTDPARSLQGKGVVLMSRFDFAARVDYTTAAKEPR